MKTRIIFNIQTIIVSVVIASIGFISCTGNSSSSNTKSMDSMNTTNKTMNTATSENEQNMRMKNDTAEIKTGLDAAFMRKVAEINMEEIKLGKLAQQKGTMPHVKELGTMMVTEHTKAMADLKVLAKTKMVNLPATESEEIMDAYKTLSAKTGKEFDKAYSSMMVKGHQEAIALFETTVMDTKDADVKTMANKTLPGLKTHLKHAEMCQKECEKM